MAGKERTKNSYNSIGIKNIHDRIRLFFGENYGISFESKQGEYTRAILTMPLLSATDLENRDEN
jgi:two-component system sensor histidine kinase YesM